MTIKGGCYCGAIRFEIDGEPLMRAACHCRECQHNSGGSANLLIAFAETAFTYVKGAPTQFARGDIENPTKREFCGACGAPLLSRSVRAPGAVLLKVGSLDDPSIFGKADAAVHLADKYDHHPLPEGVAQFDRLPG